MITLDTRSLCKETTLVSFLEGLYKSSLVRQAFKKKAVRINGKRVSSEKAEVHPGDIVTLHIDMEKPERIPEILQDGGYFVIINKPAGTIVQQNRNLSFEESLEGQVYRYFKTMGREAFLVHRLDKDTSGCLLFACEPSALKELKALSGSGTEEKTYITLLKGIIPRDSGSITNKLPGRDGKPVTSRTDYSVLERFPEAGVTLAEAVLQTGRLHQIRLHFAGLGYPVAGDDEHGDFRFNKLFRKTFGLKRQFLHAQKLSFPCRGETVSAEAPLPKDLLRIVSLLRKGKVLHLP